MQAWPRIVVSGLRERQLALSNAAAPAAATPPPAREFAREASGGPARPAALVMHVLSHRGVLRATSARSGLANQRCRPRRPVGDPSSVSAGRVNAVCLVVDAKPLRRAYWGR